MKLEKYLEMIDNYPSLFAEGNSLLKIVNDRSIILNWQQERRKELLDKQYPQDWADIGVILDDPYNLILRDLVLFPDGEMRGYARAIMQASLRGGKGVVVLPEYQGKILLLHQYRHPTRQWHYQIPLGYGEPNIPPDENARREVEEETGGQILELVNLGEFYCNPGYESASVALFYAKLAAIGTPEINEGIESFVWLTVKELEDWIANEKITDGFTIAAYTKAKLKGLI
ncbi:MAG: NUDIX hydrolase [Chloroflexi bacterium]|nr:NUDIX hydrolase [Chloroflexota bacterium]